MTLTTCIVYCSDSELPVVTMTEIFIFKIYLRHYLYNLYYRHNLKCIFVTSEHRLDTLFASEKNNMPESCLALECFNLVKMEHRIHILKACNLQLVIVK